MAVENACMVDPSDDDLCDDGVGDRDAHKYPNDDESVLVAEHSWVGQWVNKISKRGEIRKYIPSTCELNILVYCCD